MADYQSIGFAGYRKYYKVKTYCMSKKTFHIVSLGCAKNTVDSDSMAQLLTGSGYELVTDSHRAHVLIVNTCGFIDPAKEESLNVLAKLAAKKKSGQVLIAAGCLTQRYGVEVAHRVPGIDGILGTRRWMDVVKVVESLGDFGHTKQSYQQSEAATVGTAEHGALRISVQG